MSPIIISDKDPYVLDYIKGYDKIPALTHKNSNFIEAVVRLDSNYAKESSLVPPDQGFKPDTHVNHAKGLYSGSSKYWFDAMVKGTEPFDTALLGAIIAIDRSNSTHLEASNGGRLEMHDRIIKKCTNHHDLENMLNQKFRAGDKNHLISILSQPVPAKRGGVRCNVSFASKFCNRAAAFFKCNREYSKYDNVVSDALPTYAEIYIGGKYKKSEFKIDYNKQKKLSNADKARYRLSVYEKYIDCIGNIIDELKKGNIQMSRDEVDHIIWYGFKG